MGQWTAWTNGVVINYPVDTSTMGIFNYTIQYNDIYGLYGVPKTVIVTVIEPEPDPGNGNGATVSPIPGPSPFLILIFTLITVSYTLNKTVRNKAKKTR